MARINWGTTGSRRFEMGVDRGVLYVGNNSGVPWNGIISVTEDVEGGETKAYYLDGERFLTRVKPSEYKATLSAYSSPEEFDAVDGTIEVYEGLSATHQPKKEFGLSYRTLVGDDVDSRRGYKIHILYNVYAQASAQDFASLSDSPEAASLTWELTSTPPQVGPSMKPTSHFIVDSTKISPETLAEIEEALYGSDAVNSNQPSVPELLAIFAAFAQFKLTLLGNGRYSVEGSAVTIDPPGIYDSSLDGNAEAYDSAIVGTDNAEIDLTYSGGADILTRTVNTFTMEDDSITDLGGGRFSIE